MGLRVSHAVAASPPDQGVAGFFGVPVMAALVLVLLALAALLIYLLTRDARNRQRGSGRPHSGASSLRHGGREGEPPTSGDEAVADGVTAEIPGRDLTPLRDRERILDVEEVEALEEDDPREAVRHWGRLGRWDRVARCHEKLKQTREAARVWLALDRPAEAERLLAAAIQAAPADEETRNLLVAVLLDSGRKDDALELVRGVTAADSPVRVGAWFLENTARHFEAANELGHAMELYQHAHRLDDTLPELNQRLLFLRQFKRLQKEAPSSAGREGSGSEPRELLERFISDSSPRVDLRQVNGGGGPPAPPSPAMEFAGHEIIVGHLALGCQNTEPPQSVRSLFALSRRYRIERMISESPAGAVFEATDRLLDFSVALKLHRLPSLTRQDYAVLRERLRAITQLNHPNLAKVTFADREGPNLRLAMEYLPGGNLRDFLQKLGGVGLPLLVRMAMHLASALHTAHLRGIPHGDLRPENILIGTDQRLKVVDFAVAPIPIAKVDLARQKMTESIDTPRIADLLGHSEGIQSDLVQMGDILEFMLENSRRTVDPVVDENSADPLEELREVVLRLRNGSFTSVLRLWQVLEQIFERAMQATSATETHRSNS